MPTREQVAELVFRVRALTVTPGEVADEIIALFPHFTSKDAALLRTVGFIVEDHPLEHPPEIAIRLHTMADAIDGGARGD